jgi:hypothetical protein
VAGQEAHVSFVADAAPPAPLAVTMPASATSGAAAAPAVSTEAPAPSPPDDQTPKPFWTARTISAVAFAGAAAVTVGFAAGFGVASQNHKTTVSGYKSAHPSNGYCVVVSGMAAPSDCGPWNAAVNAQNRDADISNALYFTAGALALGAVVSWFFWPKPGHVKSAWVLPEMGPGSAGVEAGGRF